MEHRPRSEDAEHGVEGVTVVDANHRDDGQRDERSQRERQAVEEDTGKDPADRFCDRRRLEGEDGAQPVDADAARLRQESNAALMLRAKEHAGFGEVGAPEPEELEHRHGETDAKVDQPTGAEPSGERNVVKHARMLMPMLFHAPRRSNDEAQEDVAEAARDASWVERRDGGHDVLGRAKWVVLVAVLDVGDAVAIEEPGTELDSLLERGGVEPCVFLLGVAL